MTAVQSADGTEVCIQCDKTKELTEFRKSRGKRRKTCQSCEQANEREVQTRKLRAEGHGEEIDGDLCECSACHEVKAITDFPKRSTSKDGFSNKCQVCTRAKRPVVKKEKKMKVDVTSALDKGLPVPEAKPEHPANATVKKEDIGFDDVKNGAKDVIDDGKDLVEDVKEIIEDVQEVKDEVLTFWGKLKAVWANTKLAWNGLVAKWK